MITIFFYCSTHPGREQAMRELVVEMTRVSREQDRAVSYTFHQRRRLPTEWLLLEQWSDRAALEAHMANMIHHFGQPPAGARLPARMHELVADFRTETYDVVE